MDNTTGIHGILTFMWFAPLIFFGTVLFTELFMPTLKLWFKKFLIYYMLILCVIFEFFLIAFPFSSVHFRYPNNPGENLIDNTIIAWSPLYILLGLTVFPGLIVIGGIILYQALHSTGVVRKKFFLLFLALVLFFGFGAIDLTVYPSTTILLIVRFIMITGGIIFYFGIKSENVEVDSFEIEDTSKQTETSLLDSLSYYLPEDISTEDIAFYREFTLCIVCKKKLSGYSSIYICPDCKTLYCDKCARELIEIDNMCWGCMRPIDKSKPVRVYEASVKEEPIVVDSSDSTPKKAKENNDLPKLVK
ncbi:MAG: FYVE zinc finger domain-containing protein [Candidatus Hermodarchaeota archaeon]